MHVIVVGCGRVGSELAVSLEQAGHDVAIIDKKKAAFRRLPDGWGGQTVEGYGYDRDHLEEAGVRRAGALAAVTSGDNSNVLTARIARENFQIANVVARIYDPRRAVIYQRLGIPTVATVTWTTDQVMRRLFPEQSSTEWTDPSGAVSLIERSLPAGWAGRSLGGLNDGDRFKLVSVTRAGQARIATPELMGQEGDVLVFIVRRDAMDQFNGRLAVSTPTGGHH
jgi:trk system potassium uptake protein TrkA